MKFCVISPAAGLSRFSTRSDLHLVLSHVDNPLYQQFYLNRREAGDTLILDNGTYEGKFNLQKLIEKIGLYHPQVVTLPDKMYGGKTSDEAADDFMDKYGANFHSVRWMYVMQPARDESFDSCLERTIFMVEKLSPAWVAIPRVMETLAFPNQKIRSLACIALKAYFKHNELKVHAFGMANGKYGELKELAEAGCDSIDSSAPVWRGWNGYRLGLDDKAWDMYGEDVDFDIAPATLQRSREALINLNLADCGVK
jgi:hypothetical protein